MKKKLGIADGGWRDLRKIRGKIRIPVLIGLILIGLLVTGHYGQAATLSFQPAGLERTLFSKRFHSLTISGSAPEGAQIIIKVLSPTKEFKLNKSGKGLGFVWLPIGHAEVKKLPGMYALLSSGKISGMLTPEQQKALGLSPDYQEIYNQAELHYKNPPKEGESTGLKKEYITGLIKILEEGSALSGAGKCRSTVGKPIYGPG